MKAKNIFRLFLGVILIFTTSCKSSSVTIDEIEGKYKMVKENNYKLPSGTYNIYKEYKDGEFIDYKLNKDSDQKYTRFSGEYYIVNDSVYVEYLQADNMSNNQLTGKAYAFNYSIKNDTLIQEGGVYVKLKGNSPKNLYYESRFKTYYVKLK